MRTISSHESPLQPIIVQNNDTPASKLAGKDEFGLKIHILKKSASINLLKIQKAFSFLSSDQVALRDHIKEKISRNRNNIELATSYLIQVKKGADVIWMPNSPDTPVRRPSDNKVARPNPDIAGGSRFQIGQPPESRNLPPAPPQTVIQPVPQFAGGPGAVAIQQGESRNLPPVPPQTVIQPMQPAGAMPAPVGGTVLHTINQTANLPQAYAMPTALPDSSYFQMNWYPTAAQTVPTPASMAQSTHAPLSRTAPPISAPPITLREAPDAQSFGTRIHSELTPLLAEIDRWEPSQVLHALAHAIYSNSKPVYSNPASEIAVLKAINTIEQIRLDYVPNANDRTPNGYKVQFNNILRHELIARLPDNLRQLFLDLERKYPTVSDFGALIGEQRKLIDESIQYRADFESRLKAIRQPGAVDSEWITKMNVHLQPARAEAYAWDNKKRYAALYFMLRGNLDDVAKDSITVADYDAVNAWNEKIENIRENNVHDADNRNANEQKVFFNNNLRSVLSNELPAEFRERYNAIWGELNGLDSEQQKLKYTDALNKSRSLVLEYINKQ